MKSKIKVLFIGLALLLLPALVFAGGKQAENIYISANEIIDGNYLAVARTIHIEGAVNGDVIVAGKNVVVSGPVSGDVIVLGCDVTVNGPVQGDVRLFGCDLTLSSVVARNATFIGANVTIDDDANIGWGAMVAAGQFKMLGSIAKDLRGVVGDAVINGKIGEDTWLKVGDKRASLLLQPKTWIGGDFVYSSRSLATIMAGATVNGEIDFKSFRNQLYSQDAPSIFFGMLMIVLIKLIGLLILGLLLVRYFPKKVAGTIKLMHKRFWPSFGIGIGFVFLTPLVILLLLFSFVGWSVAIVLGSMYLIGILSGIILISTACGEWLLKKLTKRHWRSVSQSWSMVLGVTIFALVVSVPLLGGLVKIFLVSLGVGALLIHCKETRK